MSDAEWIRYLEESIRELRKEKENLKKEKWEIRQRLLNVEEENRKIKLHIEAKDKAYTALLKDYEEIKKDRKKILDEIEAEIEWFKSFRNR